MPSLPMEYLRSASKTELQYMLLKELDRASALKKEAAAIADEAIAAEVTAQLISALLEHGPALASCPDTRQLPLDFNPPQEIKFTPQVVCYLKEARRKRA